MGTIIALALIAVLIVAIGLLSRWVVRPLATLARDADRIAGGELDVEPVRTRAREVAQVGDAMSGMAGARVFQAGTRSDGDRLVTAGGRVLAVTATGPDVAAAQAAAYRAVDAIDFPTGFCRRDIGWREIARTTPSA